MKRLSSYLLLAPLLFASASTIAKSINFYSEPKAESKITGTLNTDAGITIVYTPKSGEWIKVANPANGDVGWIKSSELGSNGYNLRVMTSGNGANHYSVYQFGTNNNRYNPQTLEKEMQQFDQQQRQLHLHMAHMFNDMFYFPQPIFIPVVMVPQQPTQPKASSAKTIQTTPTVETTPIKKS